MFAEIPPDLIDLLKQAINGNIEEYEIEVVPNEKGVNMVAEIQLVTLTRKRSGEKIPLVVKQEQIVNGEPWKKFSYMCKNEVYFYDVIWPCLQKFNKNVCGKELECIPKCFVASGGERQRIVLENIKAQGYKLHDPSKPFDDDHCRIIFKTYGNYHAVSMALRELDSEQYDRLMNGRGTSYFKGFYEDKPFNEAFEKQIGVVKEYFDPDLEKGILEKLCMYEKTGTKMLLEYFDQEFPKGAIIHGDCWSNNLMFKYDEQNKLQDIKFLDFQLNCHGTPVYDLSYCFYTAGCEETLNKLAEYLQMYHSSLSNTLKEFSLDSETVYPFKTLEEEWKKYCKYCFPLGLFVWNVKLLPKDDFPDLTTDVRKEVILSEDSAETYKKRVRELITHMYKNDFL